MNTEKGKIIVAIIIFWGILVPITIALLGYIGLVSLYTILVK